MRLWRLEIKGTGRMLFFGLLGTMRIFSTSEERSVWKAQTMVKRTQTLSPRRHLGKAGGVTYPRQRSTMNRRHFVKHMAGAAACTAAGIEFADNIKAAGTALAK